jgi:hypothetical protein
VREEGGDHFAGIELASLNGAKDTREHRVRLGAAVGPIAAADLRDHGWTERVFDARVTTR